MQPPDNSGFKADLWPESLSAFYRGFAVARPMVVVFAGTHRHSGGLCGKQLRASTPSAENNALSCL